MLIREQLVEQGNFLFRWRSYLPGVMVVIAIAYLLMNPQDIHTAVWLTAASLLVSLSGIWIRIYTIGFKRTGTSGRNTKKQVADSLNSDGIYSVVRNPLYLGNFLIYWGPMLYTGSWILNLVFFVLFALYYERIIAAEEAFLAPKFGQAYEEWAKVTPAFFPKCSQFQKSTLPFVPLYALYREKEAFMGTGMTFALMNYLVEGREMTYGFLSQWAFLALCLGIAYYVVFYILGRYTSLIRRKRSKAS